MVWTRFLSFVLAPVAVLGRHQIYRNASIPLRMDELVCDSARFIGDPIKEDLNDKRCRIICHQDCWLYQTKTDIADCLNKREALNCLYEWYEGYSLLGRGCDDSKPGYYPLQLDSDPQFGLHAAMSERAMAWVEVYYHTNVEKAGNSDCVDGSYGYVSVWPESKLQWDNSSNQCIGPDGKPAHYEAGYLMKSSGLQVPIIRHDYSYTLGFNISNWLTRAGNTLEGDTVILMQANECWGSFRRRPGLGGVVVQKHHPLTDFTIFLN